MEEPINKPVSGSGCLARMYWMFGGNAILFFLAVFIVDRHLRFPSLLDVAYWIIAVTLVVVRYIDICCMHGDTAEGKPASIRDFRSYTLIVLIASSLAWALTLFLR